MLMLLGGCERIAQLFDKSYEIQSVATIHLKLLGLELAFMV